MQPRTLTDIVLRSFERYRRADHLGFKKDGRWQALNSLEVLERARGLAGALTHSGIGAGDRVAIIAPTRIEWALTDYAAHMVRAVVVPVYPTLTGAQMAYILRHSGARIAFIGGSDDWSRIEPESEGLPALEKVVTFDPIPGQRGPIEFDSFLRSTGPFREYGPFPDDLASIIYTSGTTGEPKGVLLTHGNITANVLACTAICPFTTRDIHLTFLPLSHIFERMVHYYMLWNGVSIWFAEDFAKLKENLLEVRPTLLTAVPRVLEKVLEGVEHQSRPPGARPTSSVGARLRSGLVRFALDTARSWTRARYGGSGEVSIRLEAARLLCDRLVYSKVRAKLGDRVRIVVTGGAATPESVTEFFTGAGIRVLPGYGLTETSPVLAFNTPDAFALDSVGRPIPGVEIRISGDGEILARGPNVMQGYYRNEEATAAVLAGDGWLRTGDIGELDGSGFLRITDRKKDLLVTAGGKKIPPQPIEQSLCQDPFVAQAVLVGDARPYLTALIVPRFPNLEAWARDQGLQTHDRAALLARPEVVGLFRDRVAAVCQRLARFESVKRFALIDHDFSEAGGELTPTLKVKRRVIAEKYRDRIESLYL